MVKGAQAVLIICLMALSCSAQSQSANSRTYTVSGTIHKFGIDHHMRMFKINPIYQSRVEVADSEINESGEYILEFEFSEPDLYRLDFPGKQRIMMAIDEGQDKITVNAEGKFGGYVHIAGSPDSKKLQGYEAFRIESKKRLINPANSAIRAARESNNIEDEVNAVENYVIASKAHRVELIDYIEENIGSSFALYGTVLRWTGDDNVERLDKLVTEFARKRPTLHATEVMQDKVQRFKNVAIGATAPNLSAPTPGGGTLSLSDIEAEYILIDFWASWCGPCISQVPDLQKVYHDFKGLGFEILSVSIDGKEDRWSSAISRLKLDWLHISDLKGWRSELAESYNVTFIPFNLIVDKNGTIVAKNMHSQTLHTKLTELFESK